MGAGFAERWSRHMRSSNVSLALILATVVAIGCPKADNPSRTPAAQVQKDQPVFRPKFLVNWPGAPTESDLAIPTEQGEQRHYSAIFTDRQPGGVVLYGVFVDELPEKALAGSDPKERLAAYVFANKRDETSRQAIEHGPKKYPGLDITTASGKRFGRRIVIAAGPRLYDVSVTSSKQEVLRSPAVAAFFKSFAIED
jgi:hypothetical protein